MSSYRSKTRRRPNHGGPWVPAAVVLELVAPYVDAFGVEPACRLLGIGSRCYRSLRAGESHWTAYEVVDRVVTSGLGRPELWRTDPRLAAVYAELG